MGGLAARAEREQLLARVAAECRQAQADLGEAGLQVVLSASRAAGGGNGFGVMVACEWRGSAPAEHQPSAAAAAAGAHGGAPATPGISAAGAGAQDWQRLRLKVSPAFPSEPPYSLTPTFPSGSSKGCEAGGATGAGLADMAKDELFAALPALPLPMTIGAVVDAWAQIVAALSSRRSSQ